MPYEVSMSGGGPWGFRLSGGLFAGKPTTISRVTPGGKAAQANVMQGDTLVAVNGSSINGFELPEIMEIIKIGGYNLHLTLYSQEEIAENLKNKRQSEANISSLIELERPRSRQLLTPCSERPPSQHRTRTPHRLNHTTNDVNEGPAKSEKKEKQKRRLRADKKSSNMPIASHHNMPKIVIKVGGKPNINNKKAVKNHTPIANHGMVDTSSQRAISPQVVAEDRESIRSLSPTELQVPVPKPRKSYEEESIEPEDETQMPENPTKKNLPDYIKRQIKPPKALPTEFKPQVSWLHNKLRLGGKSGQGLTDPGHSLKAAAAANPCQRIEIEGPVSATIVHAQYNTPVGMYSANQIVNTLVSTAAARGADVPDPNIFGDQNVPVDKNTSVYKLVHKSQRSSPAPAQSRSIQILDALLDYHDGELPTKFQ